MDRRFLSHKQVCRRYGDAHRSTVWLWRQDPSVGFPTPVIVNGRPLFAEDELDAFDERRRAKAKTGADAA